MKSINKMTVCIVITDMKMAGAQKILTDLIPYFQKEYENCILIVLNPPSHSILEQKLNDNNVEVIFNTYKNNHFISRKIQTWIFLKNTINKLNPDIIYVNLDYVYSWLYALLYCKKIIVTFHTQPYRISKFRIKWMVSQLCNRKLLVPILLTKSGCNEFSELFCINKSLINVIPNPIDLKTYTVQRTTSETIRITSIARFHAIKNHELLLRAFSKVRRKISNVELYLAGDGETLKRCKELTKELGIQECVYFLGVVNDIPNLLANTDIFSVSSKSESFSLVLVEAMAAGLPVVATNVGGMRDIVDENGFLVDLLDVDGYANALIKLAKNEIMRIEMGNKSKELAKNYSCDMIACKYINLFNTECTK